MIDLAKLENKIKIKIKNKFLFCEALTHKSYLYINTKHPYKDNERLEFLGDTIIEFIISHYLFVKFPNLSEGEMTLIRSALVNRERLSMISLDLDLDKFMFYNPKIGEKGLKTILSDGLEALIAAIFLDNNLDITYRFLIEKLNQDIDEVVKKRLYKDPKSKLQEYCQEKYKLLPEYDIIRTEGPEHQKKFFVGLYLEKRLISVGEGSSKQEAEIDAANKALKKMKIN
ncbi:MAG: ribonuclease 3 [Candidatus Parcubacteria bacterium]|nr:MAG: ribonuclease 3 [Candidatus Parcubacteria bacterium]